MFNGDSSRIGELLEMASLFGKSYVISQVQGMLVPHILQVFSEHDHEKLEQLILTNYPLVAKRTPQGVRNVLDNIGSNPDMREQWEGIFLQMVTPENVLEWMKDPDEWLDSEDAARQREELQKCAEVIEETPGGREWLQVQIMELYRMAHILPEDSTGPQRNS